MATLSDPRDINQVNYEEPALKSPPRLATGPLAWIRDNLFSTPLDTILTLVGGFLSISVVVGIVRWSIVEANWYAITFNLRQFTLGRFAPDQEWRIQLLALLVALIAGMALAAWARVPRALVIGAVVIVAVTFAAPPLISATIPLPHAYLLAGNVAVQSGSITITPPEQLAFLGREGQLVRVALPVEAGASDPALTQLGGFTGPGMNAVRNAAINRMATETRIEQINALLAQNLVTARQREALQAELARLEVPPPTVETLNVNSITVLARVLNGATLEPLAEAELTAGSPALEVTVPASGWYVLEKITTAGEGVAILQVDGVYPMLERSFTRSASTAPDGTVIPAGRVNEFTRFTDFYTIQDPRPRVDGEDIPAMMYVEHPYRGPRSFSDYLSMFVRQFFNQINTALALLLVAAFVGWALARALDQRLSPPEKPRLYSSRVATWLLIATPPLMFVLVLGIGVGPLPFTDTRLWGGFLLTIMLTVVGIVGSFPIGVLLALGRRSSLPVVSTFCTLYIELVRGVPLITVLFMSMLFLPLVNPALGGPDTAVYRAMVAVMLFSAAYLAENVRGGLQSVPPGQEEAAKALGLQAWQVTLFITLPQALRAVIPALVGQFIALFKDTSLVAIVGLIDLTGITQSVVAQTAFLGDRRETFVFISIIYFVFSYVMSFVSRRIESSGSGAARRL